MKHFIEKLKKYFKKKSPGMDGKLPVRVVFNRFRQVLDSNNRSLEIMADLGDKLGGNYIFDINYIKKSYSELADSVFQSIYNLNTLSQNKYLYLHRIFEKINDQINRTIQGKSQVVREPVLFYRDISWEMTEDVGGKNANLAELRNYLKLNVPDGFAVTKSAFRDFMEFNHMEEKINELKQKYRKAANRTPQEDIPSADTLVETGEHETAKEILEDEGYLDETFFHEVQDLFRKGRIPPNLEDALEKALGTLKSKYGELCRLAVRSSAEREDLEFSFAGQFETVLNVRAELKDVAEAYRRVLSSLYSPTAMAYMHHIMSEGDEMMAMSVGCIIMVDARVSGVMYSMDPNDFDNEVVMINANLGLGTTVVEGSVDADHYIVEKSEPFEIRDRKIGRKDMMVVSDTGGGIKKVPVSREDAVDFCLTDEQVKNLARQAVVIEHYMKKPQDIEWAIDRTGNIFILQSRSLKIANESRSTTKDISSSLQKYTVLMENKGIIAHRGIGAGKVFVLDKTEDLKKFEHGSVLVARHDSSQFIKIMPKASAILTDIGTPTSHMANIAREFQVPTIVNIGTGTTSLRNGEEITVDADDNKIYSGIIKELLRYNISADFDLTEAKEFRILKKILRNITPLNLIDPLLDNFTPDGCQTFHDIIRFIHEKAIAELVDEDRNKEVLRDNIAVKLDVPLPTGIFIIDIGGGLNLKEDRNRAGIDEINSIPFKAIVMGMMHPGVWHSEAISMKINDFMSSMLKMPDVSTMRYLGENVAVVSREYVNLSLRFGYHFNMMDCYCSENVRDNHVYFRFVGGATDIVKRSRRAELLSAILRELNMRINTKGDLVIARTDNISRSEMEELLNHLGRLIAFSRQLDALLNDDQLVHHYVSNFLEGNYKLE